MVSKFNEVNSTLRQGKKYLHENTHQFGIFFCYLAKNAPEFFSIDINEWYVLKWVCRACNWLHMYISVDWILVSVTGFFYLRGFKVNQAHNSAWFKSKWKLKSIVMLELASDILEKLTLIQNSNCFSYILLFKLSYRNN